MRVRLYLFISLLGLAGILSCQNNVMVANCILECQNYYDFPPGKPTHFSGGMKGGYKGIIDIMQKTNTCVTIIL